MLSFAFSCTTNKRMKSFVVIVFRRCWMFVEDDNKQRFTHVECTRTIYLDQKKKHFETEKRKRGGWTLIFLN